jgi:alkylhydroperoxidase family enzyme
MKKILFLFLSAWLLAATPATAAESLREFTPESFAAITASQKGQAYVLVVWSLDCEFCKASLATLAQKKRTQKDLKIVTLCTDQLADPQSAALIAKKLATLHLRSNAWVFGSAPPEQLRYTIDPKWHGEMPRSYWFDGSGVVRAQSGVISAQMVDQFLAKR